VQEADYSTIFSNSFIDAIEEEPTEVTNTDEEKKKPKPP
jgi:hypothetical protein